MSQHVYLAVVSQTDYISLAVNAWQSGHWLVLAAVLVMGVIAVGKKAILTKIDKKWLPLITVVVSVAGSVAAAIVAGKSWPEAVGAGVTIGLAAIGVHEVQSKSREQKKE